MALSGPIDPHGRGSRFGSQEIRNIPQINSSGLSIQQHRKSMNEMCDNNQRLPVFMMTSHHEPDEAMTPAVVPSVRAVPQSEHHGAGRWPLGFV